MNKLMVLAAVLFGGCGGVVNGLGSGGSGEGSGTGSGCGGTGYGSGSEYGTGYGTGYGSGSEYGTGYGSGSSYTGSGYGTGTGYGTGSGTEGCPPPPPGVACGLPAGCTGGLVCQGGVWSCEAFECGYDAGVCEGNPPYCVDACGDTYSSYCDGEGNWACPATPPCEVYDAGVSPPSDASFPIPPHP